jgi:uncharacterized protein (TIGR00251 family)
MYLKINVFPDFKKELVEKIDENSYKIFVREPAQRGQANKRILKILGELYPKKQIRIVSGALSPKKLIEVRWGVYSVNKAVFGEAKNRPS